MEEAGRATASAINDEADEDDDGKTANGSAKPSRVHRFGTRFIKTAKRFAFDGSSSSRLWPMLCYARIVEIIEATL